MKTEISKQFKWGFILGEQELRRIIKTCIDNAEKIEPGTYSPEIEVHLSDGSIIETQEIEDVLALENSGNRTIDSINLRIDSLETKNWSILVRFQNGRKNKKSWVSSEYEIFAESRDWVFICSSDIEDRIKRCRTMSFDYITSQRWFLIVPLFLGVLLTTFTNQYIGPAKDVADKLQNAYDVGVIKNSIEAIIFVEKTKNTYSFLHDTLPFCIAFISPMIVFAIVGLILPKFYPSYNFYWGDYIPFFDKKRSVVKLIWTVVILGVLASLIAGLILRYI